MKTLSRKGLGSGITPELWEKINNPIVFKPLSGDPAHGYEASVLIDVCDAIIQARNQGKLLPSQLKMAIRAEMIFRSADNSRTVFPFATCSFAAPSLV